MQIATSKTRDQFPLSTKKIIKKTITGSISYVITGLIILGVIIVESKVVDLDLSNWLYIILVSSLILLLIIIIVTYYYQRWYFAVYFYDLTPEFIQIKKGPITPKEITIPYERIQDVYVDQDIFDRIFGLYDVHLSSATAASGMEAHIDGVEKSSADGLRNALLEIVKQKISKNKVENTSSYSVIDNKANNQIK